MFPTLADDAITLHYQPLARCTGGVAGFEALIRWHHRQRGPVSPEAFIPVSERSGLIAPLSRWALAAACRQAASWNANLVVAVNVSAAQFAEERDLPGLVAGLLAESGLEAERLELELTEAAVVADRSRAISVMRGLRELGVGLALDDFGAHGPALGAIRDFPFSKIKIDGTVVAGIEHSASARSIIRMVIDLAHALGRDVAAEGVETMEQRAFLEAAGCDFAQGYCYGRPRPIETFGGLTGGGLPAPELAAARLAAEMGQRA
jgi:EAL domain-containing protein (putative c-di-GMP-specific phosphodiesterase class I)